MKTFKRVLEHCRFYTPNFDTEHISIKKSLVLIVLLARIDNPNFDLKVRSQNNA